MKEDLLHYVWRMQRYNCKNLYSTAGLPIVIHQPGFLNTNAGPDFLNARIKIGDTLWAGNVEMHLSASDWTRHRHQEDSAYDNVILHVVMEEDEMITRTNGQPLPCLELKDRIRPKLKKHYLRLLNNENWIPCQGQQHHASSITKELWLNRLAIERLEVKAKSIATQLEHTKGDWETTFYQFLCRSLGGKVNAEPMQSLARQVPRQLLGKHRHSLFQLEALLFGQSGLLEVARSDEYPQQLQKEYRFLRKKYQLRPMPAACWKFLRLRPANFPTIRIAQLATLIHKTANLFGKVLAAENTKELENIFDIKLSNYWWEHYNFDKLSKRKHKALGKSTIQLIIINTIIPFLFLYGKRKGEVRLQDKALDLLEGLPAENNSIIRNWKQLGMPAKTALQSQALLQLKHDYCHKKRCLECAIGNSVLSSNT